MLTITIAGEEFFDEEAQTFESSESLSLTLEHSLVSLSKWESKFQKPFLSTDEKTPEEILSYIKFMITTPNFPAEVFGRLNQENLNEINDYINSPQSATTFGTMPERPGRQEIITSELIYYWMVAFNIPFACENWHLNRLFSLVRICNIKNAKPKKLSRHEIASRNREINQRRKEELNTSG